uniref:Uncharacterized protein n=1 Tax=Arundo donax TaxID=35708 RepID=A0A0A9C7T2_ARUDO
MWPSVCRHIL